MQMRISRNPDTYHMALWKHFFALPTGGPPWDTLDTSKEPLLPAYTKTLSKPASNTYTMQSLFLAALLAMAAWLWAVFSAQGPALGE